MPKPKRIPPIKKGDTIELDVDTLASGGDGLGRYQGYTVFVPQGLCGDRVYGEVVKETPNYAVLRILKILERSENRIHPPCAVFPDCGGCQLQNLSYDKQFEFKVQVVRDSLERLGKREWPSSPEFFPAEKPFQYRNKGSYALETVNDELRIGFYRTGSHEVVDSQECGIMMPVIDSIREWLRPLLIKHQIPIYREKGHSGFLKGIVVRHSVSTGETLLGLVTTQGTFSEHFLAELLNADSLQAFGVRGVLQNINPSSTNVILGEKNRCLYGRPFIRDRLGPLEFQLSLNSFFQVNPFQTEKLYSLLQNWIESDDRIIDAYCGVGGIGLWLARLGCEVLGIDEVASAIKDAQMNARINRLENCEFICGTVESHIDRITEEGMGQTLILDPPRKGCSETLISAISNVHPRKIIYVSCNPSTLARDLSRLKDYSIRSLAVVDMFPQTSHVETAVLLTPN